MSETNLSSNNPAPDEFLIVGIGASAGGIQALKEFFEHVPADSGMAYVVILHLSPDHNSRLAEVLQSVARIPVTQVIEKVLVVPDHVYVVPPNRHLEMQDGSITVSPNTLVEERRAPVDIFFRTLAESHGARAVAVVLSGTGANGSMGLKRIKEKGGTAFVQNPREAEFSEMPRNSIATDLVDDILSVAAIPAKIIAYKESLGTIAIPVEAEARPEDQQQALREIFTQLRLRTGHDFSNYKRPTLLRRIERRINIHNLPDLPSYSAFTQKNPEETQALLKDLLISVTNFFRDHRAFEAIERDIMPLILHGKKAEDALRLWVVGCATGEEAYSIAMLCAERTLGAIEAPKVQIFATDIDEQAIATAREGLYTLNDAADVSPERLRRFFTKEGELYRIRRELREMVLFAVHNALKDPPFSRLDLVSCRNMLIYLNQTAQERVMETLHFALNPGGYLFLGSSESVDGAGDLYAPVSREYHIFQSRQVSARAYPVPESVPSFRLEKQYAADLLDTEKRTRERVTYGDLHQRLLEQYAPPSVVVNEEYDVVHLTQGAGRYLQVAGGELSQNLLKLIRPELRLELRTALYQATQRRTDVEARNLQFRVNSHVEAVNIHIRPVLHEGDTARGFLLGLFEPGPVAASDEEKVFPSDEPMARQLEEELMRLKAQLRTSNERHVLQAVELKTSNEELQAMNEELRSTAEELETSKEELQSINEELTTVNQELKVKIEEIVLAGDNLQNLINSTDIGTIFLDRNFRVNWFTPAACRLFNLIPGDFGRPLSDITHRLEYPDLINDAETVLERLQTIEREVRTTDGGYFLIRVSPYRTADDRIQGVVITFLEITAHKRAEEAKFYLASIVESSEDAMLTINLGGTITSWNKAAEQLYGYPASEAIGKPLTMLTLPAGIAEVVRNAERIKDSKQVEIYDTVRVNKDGREMNLEVVLSPVKNSSEVVIGISIIARDVTERRRAVEALRQSEEGLRVMIENLPGGAAFIVDRDLRYVLAEGAALRAVGLKPGDLVGKTIFESLPPELAASYEPRYRRALAGESFMHEHEAYGATYVSRGTPLRDAGGEVYAVLAAFYDITERKHMEEAMRRNEEQLRLREAELARVQQVGGIGGLDVDVTDGLAGHRSPEYAHLHGLPAETRYEAHESWLQRVHPHDREEANQALLDAIASSSSTYENEYRIIRSNDGVERWIFAKADIERDSTGRAVRLIGAHFDITERKRAEEAVRESEERLRLLVESVTDYAIISMDAEGHIESWNVGAKQLFGYTEEEVRGQGVEIIFTPEDRDAGAPEKEMQQAREAGRGADERWHMRKDGSRFYVSGTLTPLSVSGQLAGYVKIARDLTVRQQAEEALRHSHEELEQIVQQRTQELRTTNDLLVRQVDERRVAEAHIKELLRQIISAQEKERRRISRELHDSLGQQLTALRMGLETLPITTEPGANERFINLREMLKRLDSEVDFLAWELRPASLDELGLIPALLTYVEEWTKQFGVAAEFHTNQTSDQRFSYEIETNLYRIAQEALNNTAKYAQATQASVLLEYRDNHLVLIIEDNGVGFAWPGEPLPNSADKGLGLINMHERAALLGGMVEIESSLGKGTTIFVRIPMQNM